MMVADQLAAGRRHGIEYGPGTPHTGSPQHGMRYAVLPSGLRVPLGEALGPVGEATAKRYGAKIHQVADQKPAGLGDWWGRGSQPGNANPPTMPMPAPTAGALGNLKIPTKPSAPPANRFVSSMQSAIDSAKADKSDPTFTDRMQAVADSGTSPWFAAAATPANVDPRFVADMRGAIDSSRGPAAFDPMGAGYDYDRAVAAGMGPDGTGENAGHWGSVAPVSAEEAQKFGLPEGSYVMLKGQGHPTFHKAVAAEKARGSQVVSHGGRFYSVPAGGAPAADPMFVADMHGAIDSAKASPAVMRTGAQPAAQTAQPQSLLERVLMQLPYGLSPEQAEQQRDRQRAETFLEMGLDMTARASQPGATALGALSEGALSALHSNRQKEKDRAALDASRLNQALGLSKFAMSVEDRDIDARNRVIDRAIELYPRDSEKRRQFVEVALTQGVEAAMAALPGEGKKTGRYRATVNAQEGVHAVREGPDGELYTVPLTDGRGRPLTPMPKGGGVTATQRANNAEVRAARTRLRDLVTAHAKPGETPRQTIQRLSKKTTPTGRANPDYDASVRSALNRATQRMTGEDEQFDKTLNWLDQPLQREAKAQTDGDPLPNVSLEMLLQEKARRGL